MSSYCPRPDGAYMLHETFRYGSEVSHRQTFGDDLERIIATHTEIEPEPVRTNLRGALSGIDPTTAVEFGWSTYTLHVL